MSSQELSYLDLVNICDSFPDAVSQPKVYSQKTAGYYKFTVLDDVVGYLLPSVVEAIRDNSITDPNAFFLDDPHGIVALRGDSLEERSANIAKTLQSWREKERFKVLKAWRDELYGVYISNSKPVFHIERSGSTLFGVITYGSHMTAYQPATETSPMKIWVAKRSEHKTYGGMLDNSVAGGIAAGISPLECMIKESGEEASLTPEIVEKSLKPAGCVSYFSERTKEAGGEVGLLQPECQFVYDIALPTDIVLRPSDDEVQGFTLMDVGDAIAELKKGKFKPNCSLVLLDFLIRHGYINAENEPNIIQIVQRIHRRFEFPIFCPQ